MEWQEQIKDWSAEELLAKYLEFAEARFAAELAGEIAYEAEFDAIRQELLHRMGTGTQEDERFSPRFAQVPVCNRMDTIENHFELSKRFGDAPVPRTSADTQGRTPTHFVVGEEAYPVEYLTQWYELLWLKYLDAHPELDAIPSSNEIVQRYREEGRRAIYQGCAPLLTLMKKNKVMPQRRAG